MKEVIKLLKEIEAWLCFNGHPTSEQISDFRMDLKLKIEKLESKLTALESEEEKDVDYDSDSFATPPPKDMYDYPLSTTNNHIELEQSERAKNQYSNPFKNK